MLWWCVFTGDPLPSFYFPEYVELFDDCPDPLRDAVTVLVLERIASTLTWLSPLPHGSRYLPPR
jgi:hypothetical protein